MSMDYHLVSSIYSVPRVMGFWTNLTPHAQICANSEKRVLMLPGPHRWSIQTMWTPAGLSKQLGSPMWPM